MGSFLPPPGEPRPLAAAEFVQSAPPNTVSFELQKVAPPSDLYVQRDDVLVIYGESYLAPVLLKLIVRFLPAAPPAAGQPAQAGQQPAAAAWIPGSTPIQVIEQDLILPAPGVDYNFRIPLAEGYLLSIGIFSSDIPYRGDCFVHGHIQREISGLGPPFHSIPLFADFVAQSHMAGWPWGRTINPAEDTGHLTTIHPANPAAGADWILIGGFGGRWKCHSVRALLTTAVAAANRLVTVEIRDIAGNLVYRCDALANQAASLAWGYSAAPDVTMPHTLGTDLLLPLPGDLMLENGSTVRSSTAAIQAADQWSMIYAAVEQWFD